jgi:hypothetical protein
MRKVLLAALLCFVFTVPVHATVQNPTAIWLDYFNVEVSWNYTTGDNVCIYKSNPQHDGNVLIFLDCTSGNVYRKPAVGDVRYTSRQGDVYILEERSGNRQIGNRVTTNPLGERPARSSVILPAIIKP